LLSWTLMTGLTEELGSRTIGALVIGC
jgi:hypothetical protein